jgi:hypothetical protein
LDENLNRPITTFDEVRHQKDRWRDPWCDLKRRPPESRPAAPSREEAARKDPAVHVSLSSDSPVKQPGTGVVPPKAPESHRTRRFRWRSEPGQKHLSEGFIGAPSRRGGRRTVERLYMLPAFGLSTASRRLRLAAGTSKPLWASHERTATTVRRGFRCRSRRTAATFLRRPSTLKTTNPDRAPPDFRSLADRPP